MTQAVKTEKPDMIFHLGDVIRDARKLQEAFPQIPVEFVVGNCDGYAGDDTAPEEREVFLGGRRILLCHGHVYRVKMGDSLLVREGKARGMGAVLCGHTHSPTCYREGDMWVMNPGTVSGLPQATYGVIETDGEGLRCRIVDCPRPKGVKKSWF